MVPDKRSVECWCVWCVDGRPRVLWAVDPVTKLLHRYDFLCLAQRLQLGRPRACVAYLRRCVPSLRSIRRLERKEGGGVLMKKFFGPLPSGSMAAFTLAFRPCAVSGSLRKGPDAAMRVLNVTSYGRLRQLAGRRSNGRRSSLLLVSAPARMKPGSSVDELVPLLCGSTRAVLRHSYFLPLGETVFKERLCK